MQSDKDYFEEERKMLNGEIYNAYDENLSKIRFKVRTAVHKYNKTSPKQEKLRKKLLQEILGKCGKDVFMEPSINFDYGCNTTVGNYFFANFNSVILDCAAVEIGDGVMFGPNVTIAPPFHPLVASERIIHRRTDGSLYDKEYAKPVKIGNNVWLASGVTVCGGVTIGDNTVIGAGSVVTRSIPSGVIAVGNPCRVLREITDADLAEHALNREQRLKSSSLKNR